MKADNPDDINDIRKQRISIFRASCTALAGTIGAGNISGVAIALTLGGPGAVFWMWAAAILGMFVSYLENVLGIIYRHTGSDGRFHFGPMAYIEYGSGLRWPARLFAFFCLAASFGIGNMSQAHEISVALSTGYCIPPVISALFLCFITWFIISGGLKRIAFAVSGIVPFMSLFYIAGAAIILFRFRSELIPSIKLILHCAFNPFCVGSGCAGFTVSTAVYRGMLRSIYSNEAGMGSSVLAHSSSVIKDPALQGLIGSFEVFADTIIMCTLTALVLLTSGAYDINLCGKALVSGELPALAFSTVFGNAGNKFLCISIVFFSFSSILAWFCYGSMVLEYLYGKQTIFVYRILYTIILFAGCVAPLDPILKISDICNLCMMLPNLAAIICLLPEALYLSYLYR